MPEHWYALPDAIVEFSINGEAQEMTEVTDAVIEAQY
jgi:simple sugar transport system substrate-binding protein